MAHKREENMKAVPIKNYDFQVDFKVNDQDVMETFLDPAENKHISVLKRPQTTKTSTWGTPKPLATKKFATVQTAETDLAIKGTANPVSESVKGDNPLPSNMFHFKSHLPSKRLSENPKLALSMFKKKTISAKSGKTIQGGDPFSYTGGPDKFSQTGELKRPQTAVAAVPQGIQGNMAVMTSLPSGKKLTAKGAAQLKETKETNALKSSGAAHGLFAKLPASDQPKEGKAPTQRPKSAIVSSAVGFMQELKKTKKLKPPKKPDFEIDEDEEVEVLSEFNDKENNLSNKDLEQEKPPKPKKVVPKKEPAKPKKASQDEVENVDNGENAENEDDEDLGGTENQNPYEKMAKMIKKAKVNNVQEEEENEDNIEEFPSDEEEKEYAEGEEEGEVDEDLFQQEEDIAGTESMNPSGPNAARKGAKAQAKATNDDEEEGIKDIPSFEEGEDQAVNENQNEDENLNDENNEDNNDNNENNDNDDNNNNNNEENQDEEQRNMENEMRQSATVSETYSTKIFRSNMANELKELQGAVLTSADDQLSNYSGTNRGPAVNTKAKRESAKPPKETIERKEKTDFDKARNQFIQDTKKQSKGFVPYKYLNDLDGETVQKQREQVTDEITNYLRATDQRRQKKLGDKGTTRYSEPSETNEFSSKIEALNARLKNSLQGVKNIISSSKAITGKGKKEEKVEDIDSSPEDQDEF